MPPNASQIVIASGQPSTDSISASPSNELMDRASGARRSARRPQPDPHESNRCGRVWPNAAALRRAIAAVGPRRDSAMAVSSHRVPVRRQCGLGQQKDRVSHEPATRRRLTRAALLAAMDPLAGASPPYHLSSPAWAALGGQTVQQRREVAASSAALHQALTGAVP